MTQSIVFDTKKPVNFFHEFQHFCRVLFLRGQFAQFLPAFFGLTLHRGYAPGLG